MAHPIVLLDDARAGRERLSVFTDLAGTVTARDPAEVAPALAALEVANASGLFAAGYFSYELGYALEPRLLPLMPPNRKLPLLWFGLFRSRRDVATPQGAEWLENQLTGRAYAGPLRLGEAPDTYAEIFSRARDYILAGDAYQVNLTFQARFSFLGDPLALYARLRGQAQAGHGAYVHDGERSILSFSPELFFSVAGGTLTARPMKGTAPRGADADADARLAAALRSSAKDRAENLMIVDLIRNDAGRIAKTGSVKATDLFAVETYPTVHQMVSTVAAELRDGVGAAELIKALFPCGSITGAPKIRAMEIIRELEKEPRGLYCGAIGAFAPDGPADFNVAIRTLTIEGSEGRLGIGGGIVADSNAVAEYDECLIKARFFTETRLPLSLIETLRFEPEAGLVRGPLHLARLAGSAAALGIPFDERSAADALADAVKGATGPQRVRLQLNEDGAVEVSAVPFVAPAPQATWTYRISPHRVRSFDRLLRHKTDWRKLYDEERAAANRAGCEEVVFLNEAGEVAEGSLTNLFLVRDGRMLTPPLSSGALPGCLRRDLLDAGECQEAVLLPADLDNGEAYLGNSLRGLIRAVPFKA